MRKKIKRLVVGKEGSDIFIGGIGRHHAPNIF